MPWLDVIRGLATMFGATMFLLAALIWVALRWSSFAVASGVGITGTVMTLILGISARADM